MSRDSRKQPVSGEVLESYQERDPENRSCNRILIRINLLRSFPPSNPFGSFGDSWDLRRVLEDRIAGIGFFRLSAF